MNEQLTWTDRGLIVRAPAKINLSLLIAGKRPDGFHEIETVMSKINWYDELLFEPGTTDGIELLCQGPYWAPDGPENLVWRACEEIFNHIGYTIPIKATLTKNIPAGTGLGSASSDCAAALIGLDKFAKLGLPDETLHHIAASLGSDINFFLGKPLAFCTGRGEKIEEIDKFFDFSAALIVPNVSVSTIEVYKNYKHDEKFYFELFSHINPLITKKKIDYLVKICANMLMTSCFQLYPELAELKKQLECICNLEVCLSGSGSAMYAMLSDVNRQFGEIETIITGNNFNCVSRIVNNNRW